MPNYGDPRYWDDRYKQHRDSTFDWLENYHTLKPLLDRLLQRSDRILNVGCGNGELTEEMFDDGYAGLVNSDISAVVVEQMADRNRHRPGMQWLVDDALDMQFDDESFDAVLDKSTLDAILCGKQPALKASQMLAEVQRVLKTGGVYIIISYGSPDKRLPHVQRPHLAFDVEQFVMRQPSDQPGKPDSVDSSHAGTLLLRLRQATRFATGVLCQLATRAGRHRTGGRREHGGGRLRLRRHEVDVTHAD